MGDLKTATAMTVRRSTLRVWGLGLFLCLYLCFGGFIFGILEGPHEDQLRSDLRTLRQKFLKEQTCITDGELEAFLEEVIAANDRGVSATRNVSSEPNWSFGQSLFFAGTILTTIGYGRVTPLSEGGKIFCIVYAIIGIPLTLIMFTALVERLMILTGFILEALHKRLGHLYKTFHIRLIHLGIIFLFLIVFIFLIPAAIFTEIENDWNYLDSFYYCFISLTTIGLGDYIPGDDSNQSHRPIYKICTTFYLFVGLTCMMFTLANIYDIPELNIGYHFYMKSDEDEESSAGAAERSRLQSGESGEKPPKYGAEQVNQAYQSDQERKALTGSINDG